MAKNISRTVTIYINGKEVEASLKNIRAEIKKLQNEQAKLPIGTEEYIQKTKELNRLNSIVKQQREAVNGLSSAWDTASVKLTTFANVIQAVQSIMAMGDSAIGSLKDLVKDAASLDDAYADVMKTTGLTHKQVEELNETFAHMDTRTSREQLNLLAYEAGKLGLNTTEAVAQFVSAADKINIALGDVLGEGAMVTIGKVADVYSKSTDQLRQKDLEGQLLAIGSAINSLGQASTANEQYLVEFLSRMGGVATQAGMSADQILAFASALDQANMPVEMSATALQRLVGQMIQKPEEFIRAADMTLTEFKDMLEKDMYGAVQKVLTGMDRMGGFTQLLPMFSDMGLDGQRAASVIATLASSLDKVSDAQHLAAAELSTGNSVLNEFATKNSSMAAEAEKAKKVFEDMRIELGNQLYPVVTHLTRASTTALKGLSGYLNLWKENRVAAIALTSAMGTLVAMLTKSYIIKAKERVIDVARSIQMRTQSAITAQAAAAEAKHAAAREANKLATINQRIEVYKKIVADAAEYKAIGANNLVLSAERNLRTLTAAATVQQTVATNAQIAATKAQKAAFASTPWGAVLVAVTSLAAGMALLVRRQGSLRRESRELNKQIASESASAQYLFDKLSRLNEGSEQYRDTLSKLNELYPDILSKYTTEEGKLTSLANARQAVIDKIREQITEQRRLDKYSDIAGTFSEETDRLKERIYKKATQNIRNDSKAQEVYADILSVLPSDYSSETNFTTIANNIRKIVGKDLMEAWDGLDILVNRYVASVNKAYKEQKKFEQIYGDSTETSSATTTTTTTTTPATPAVIPTPESVGADKNVEKWKTVLDAANSLISDFTNKSKSGADQLFSEIDARSEAMAQRIRNNTEASKADKDELLKNLAEATLAYKNAKLEDYIAKINDRLDSQLRSASTNPLLDKVLDASRTLQLELNKIDAAIAQVNADLAVEGLSESQRSQLQALIDKYHALRSQISRSAFSAIDTSVDASTFAVTGDRQKDMQHYAELTSRINRAREAALAMIAVTTDQTLREEYAAQVTELDEQAAAIKQVMDQYELLVNKINRTTAFDKLVSSLDSFASQATSIFSNIVDYLDNIAEQELQDAEKLRDQNISSLEKQLEAGFITQSQYEKKKAELEEEYDAKSKAIALEKWQRDKNLSLTEATIAGALAILRVWAEKGNGTTAMRAAQTALVAASTAAQIAAIAATPKPYAQGGYVPSRTYFMAGEAGAEWVASNRLLADHSTAPIISALERYQRGDNNALSSISMDHVSSATTAAVERQRIEQAAFSAAMLSEMQQLNRYLSDPANRQAYISRQAQERFDANENFLRSQARLK